ncbi:MAG: SDR family oxidoreductase, partial [Rhodospirillaceae bacterium]|nr:SDR family oxidoreductase [Rhodospirillaceae bacterium]
MARTKRRGFAIVGMACRFPDADDPESYWANLLAGRESIRPVSDTVLREGGVAATLLSHTRYRKFASALTDIDLFDAETFGYSPAEAVAASPQHRLFLETCWEALEDGGYTPEGAEAVGPVGVWAGESPSNYARHALYTHSERGIDAEYLQHLIGGDRDYLASAVSYRLGLTGPSLAIQTACSTSLVAVLAACDALATGSCAMALAGGATVRLPPRAGYLYQDGGIFSDDGHCRPFDARAGGTVFGSGVGTVLLKRVEDAVADGDPIHAVILGGAVNNDGAVKVGFTAPSPDGQQRVIASALKNAGIEAATVGYVEAHGTATPIGDPIEFEALAAAFGLPAAETCALGTVKSNLGHLETAAGVAGLIKAACAVREGLIPPNLHFETRNPEIDFAHSPFFVPVATTPWPVMDTPRRAGVSSFGVGGTNAHLLLEEPPRRRRRRRPAQARHILLSAPSEAALRATAGSMAQWLHAHLDVSLADVAATLRTGRRRFSHELGLMAEDAEGLADALEKVGQGATIPHDPIPDDKASDAAEPAGRRLHLPVTVRGRARYWIDPERAGYRRSPAVETAMAGSKSPDPLGLETLSDDEGGARFGYALTGANPWCADHRRDGIPVLAGAAVAVLMHAAAGSTLPVLEDLRWRKMIEPGPDGARLEITVSGPDRTEIRLTEVDGAIAAEARVGSPVRQPAPLDPDAIATRCGDGLSSEALYRAFARHGFAYGPVFRRCASIAVGDGECLARLVPAETSPGQDAGAFDAALQAAFPLLPTDGATWVPVGLDRLAVHDGAVPATWVHVRRHASDGATCRFDMTLCDEAGRVLATVEGARLRRVADPLLMRAGWQAAELPSERAARTGTLFLLGTDTDAATVLARHLPEGLGAVRVESGIAFERLGDAAFAIDLIEAEDWRQLLDATAGGTEPVLVLDLLDEAASGGTDRGLAAASLSKVLQSSESPRGLRWLTAHRGEPGAAAMASLGRVLAREEPAHSISALHLEAATGEGLPGENLEAIAAELLVGDAPSVRLGADGREVRVWTPVAQEGPRAALADGLYILAGGAGALGLVLAEYILDRTPEARVALLARDMSSAGRAERIAALGPRAVAAEVDLTDGTAVEEAVANLRARYGPVRGVVHLAGTMRDGLVARFDKADFAAVASPKALGARQLDAATRDDPLDWFVLYSSLVGEVGNPGQAAYGYANGWLDAFAEERAGPGRSVSILWPYWADGGMAADPEAVARARSAHGVLPLSQAAGLRAFEAALTADATRLLVAHGDPVRLADVLEDRDGARIVRPRTAPKAMPDGVEAALIAHLRQVV